MTKLTTLKKECIKKYFYMVLPRLAQISKTSGLKKFFGNDIASLGVEKAFEIFEGFFDSGYLTIKAKDIDNFMIFRYNGKSKRITVLYDTAD